MQGDKAPVPGLPASLGPRPLAWLAQAGKIFLPGGGLFITRFGAWKGESIR